MPGVERLTELNLDPDITSMGEEAKGPDTFTVWTFNQFQEWVPPKNASILSENSESPPLITNGMAAAILGAGGIGKSRLALCLAIAQITGREFCGLQTHGPARDWLFIGNENSKSRIKSDLEAMTGKLDPVDLDLLQEHLSIQVQENVDDCILDVAEESGRKRWRSTLAEHRPDVLVIDPFEAVVSDSCDSRAIREAMTGLQQLTKSHNPNTAIIYVHHARTGAANTAQAVGYGANNFGKGSKTFYSICRFVINVAQGDAEDRGKIVLACGKSNDAPAFSTRGATLDQDTMTYHVDPSFDLDEWLNDVEGKRTNKKSVTVADIVMTIDSGTHARKEIITTLSDNASGPTIDRRIKDAIKQEYIEKTVPYGSFILTDKGRKYAQSHR